MCAVSVSECVHVSECVSVCVCVCECCECTFLLSLQFCGSGGVSEEKQTVSRDQSSRMYGCRIPGTHIV